MKHIALLLSLLFACDARVELGKRSEAQQQMAGGGLRVVRVLDGGLCSGYGTKATPLNCEVAVDNVSGTGSAGSPLTLADNLPLLIFGDGSDGDATIAANNSIGRDVFYNNLTVNAGVRLGGGGYRIHVKGTLTLNGIIHADGNNGNNGANGTTGTNVCASATAGLGGWSGFFSGGANGGNGGLTGSLGASPTFGSLLGGSGTGGGGGGSTGLGNNGANSAIAGRGGGGGSGGGHAAAASNNGGGGGGTSTFTTDAFGGITDVHDMMFAALWSRRQSQGTNWGAVGGGGGGGSCGNATTSTADREPSGGSGGASAGQLFVLARFITIGPSGGFSAQGGDGGNGGSCGTHGGDAGGGGAGGGGHGGSAFFVLGSGTMPDDSYFDVTGGQGGTGGTGCVGGQNGGDGGDGFSGLIFKWRADGQ